MANFEYKIVVSEKGIEIFPEMLEAIKRVERATESVRRAVRANTRASASAISGLSEAIAAENRKAYKLLQEGVQARTNLLQREARDRRRLLGGGSGGGPPSYGSRLAGFAGGAARTALGVTGAVVGYRTVGAIAEGARDIFRINSELEQMRLGIAEISGIAGRFVDQWGNIVPPAEQFKLATIEARNAQKEMVEDSIRLGIPLQALREGYTVIAGMAKAAGFSQRQILNLTESIATVSQRIGIDQSQVTRTIDNIISGQRVQATTLGVILGLNQADVKAARERGELAEYLLGRLEQVQALLPKNLETWEGIKAAVGSVARAIAVEIGEDAFGTAKEEAKGFLDVLNGIRNNPEQMEALAASVNSIAQGFGLAAKFAGNLIAITGAAGEYLNRGYQEAEEFRRLRTQYATDEGNPSAKFSTAAIQGVAKFNVANRPIQSAIASGSSALASLRESRTATMSGGSRIDSMDAAQRALAEVESAINYASFQGDSTAAGELSSLRRALGIELKAAEKGYSFEATDLSAGKKSVDSLKDKLATRTIAAARRQRSAGGAAKDVKAVAEANARLKASRIAALDRELEGMSIGLPASPSDIEEFNRTKAQLRAAGIADIEAEFSQGESRASGIGAGLARKGEAEKRKAGRLAKLPGRLNESSRALAEAKARARDAANEGSVRAMQAQLGLVREENGSLEDQLKILDRIHEQQRANLEIRRQDAETVLGLAQKSVERRRYDLLGTASGSPEAVEAQVKLDAAMREQIEAEERIRGLKQEQVELGYEQATATRSIQNEIRRVNSDLGRSGELIDEIVNGIASGQGSLKGAFKRFGQAHLADAMGGAIKGLIGMAAGSSGGQGSISSLAGISGLFGGGGNQSGYATTTSTSGGTATITNEFGQRMSGPSGSAGQMQGAAGGTAAAGAGGIPVGGLLNLAGQAVGIGFLSAGLAKQMSNKRNQPGQTRGDLRKAGAGMGAKIGASSGAFAGSAIALGMGMAGGAAAGAAAGSVVPVIGTIIGAALGAALGSLLAPKPKTTETLVQRQLDRSIASLEGLSRKDYPRSFINTRGGAMPSDYASIGGEGAGLLFSTRYPRGFGRGGFNPGMVRSGVLSYAGRAGYSAEDAQALYRQAVQQYGGDSLDEALKRLNINMIQGRRGSGKAGSRYGISRGAMAGAAGDIIAAYEDLPKAIDAAALAQRLFAEDGRIQIEALKRTIEDTKDTISGGLTDAFNSLVESSSPTKAAQSIAEKFADELNSRVAERLLERGDIGAALTQASVLTSQAAEKFAMGDIVGGNDLLRQARSLARKGQSDFLRVATPIAAATRGGGYGFGTGFAGVENQTGYAGGGMNGEILYELRSMRYDLQRMAPTIEVNPVLEVDGRAFEHAVSTNKRRSRTGMSRANTGLGVSQ